MSGDECRSQGSCGIYRAAGHGSGNQHTAGEGKAYRQGGHSCRDPVIGGDRDHQEDQEKDDQELHRECPEVPHVVGGNVAARRATSRAPDPLYDPGADGS